MGVAFRANPVCDESHIQRNAKREVATLKARLGFVEFALHPQHETSPDSDKQPVQDFKQV